MSLSLITAAPAAERAVTAFFNNLANSTKVYHLFPAVIKANQQQDSTVYKPLTLLLLHILTSYSIE